MFIISSIINCRLFRVSTAVVFLASMLILFLPSSVSATGDSKLAVTPQGYDNMGDVLKKLGVSADEINLSDLREPATLEQYDAIYINCSTGIDGLSGAALKQYVENGGIVYASDFANSLIDAAFPGKINFYSGGLLAQYASSKAIASRVGAAGSVEGNVIDPGMATVLGKSKINIEYDMPGWAIIDSVSPGVTVHVRGTAPAMDYSQADPATMSKISEGTANIDFSNPNAMKEFYAQYQKAAKKLANKPLVVSFAAGKGEVLYTTFHNEVQVTADVDKVLNWFALRTKVGKITQTTRNLVTGENQVLQEITDGINQGESKQYKFNASGKSNFSISLNFAGSELGIVVKSPDGLEQINQSVSQPPLTYQVTNAMAGNYEIAITGKDVPEKNYPFVVIVSGFKEAAKEILQTTGVGDGSSGTSTETKTNSRIAIVSPIKAVISLLVVIFLIIVLPIILITRRRKHNAAKPAANAVQQVPPPSPLTVSSAQTTQPSPTPQVSSTSPTPPVLASPAKPLISPKAKADKSLDIKKKK